MSNEVDKSKVSQTKAAANPQKVAGRETSSKSRQNQEDQSNADGFLALLRDPKVIVGCVFCSCIIIILQAMIVVYLLSEDADGTNDRSIESSPTMAPIQDGITSILPSSRPTTSPSIPTLQFRSIATSTGSVLLETVSNCYACSQKMIVPNIPWSNQDKVSSIVVSSQGTIDVLCRNDIVICGFIQVIEMDLAPNSSGNIYYYATQTAGHQASAADFVMISWEQVAPNGIWNGEDDSIRINAQVIVSNREVTVCYGEGGTGGSYFQSGYHNYSTFPEAFVPFVGPSFDESGGSNRFPSNTCQTLRPNQGGFMPSPSPFFTPWPTTMFKPPQSAGIPTLQPTMRPTRYPSLRPSTVLPTLDSSTFSCVPTVGPCVDNFRDLQRELAGQWGRPYGGQTVALCGDMTFAFTVRVLEPNTTVCCAGTSNCILLRSRGTSLPILRIFAENVTLSELSFRQDEINGNTGDSLVVFEKPGYHKIQHCKFSNGRSSAYGGNLLVTGAAEVRIFNTTFESGTANFGGGGIAFQNVRNVSIEKSYFLNNIASQNGGGLLFSDYDPSLHESQAPTVSIVGTTFEQNQAFRGAGFEIRGIEYPTLLFESNIFIKNVAQEVGAAGVIANGSYITATFRFNYGNGNGANLECFGFYVEEMTSTFGANCYDIDAFLEIIPQTTTVPLPSPNVCAPTNGQCAGTEDELKLFIFGATAGDTIGVCGSMPVRETVVVLHSNLTICCVANSECSLDSIDGSRRIMHVTEANFTLSGIQMQRGFAQDQGGNLLIDSPGHHIIRDSRFNNGWAGNYGGNVHIANAESATLINSTFQFGSTDLFGGKHPFALQVGTDECHQTLTTSFGKYQKGGGAAFENTPKVSVHGSTFNRNSVSFEGGAMLFFSSFEQPMPLQEVVIDRTTIEYNEALFGNVFLARNMDKLSLTIRNSFFQGNGGALGNFDNVPRVDLTFRENNGNDFTGVNDLCESVVVAQQDNVFTRCTIIPRDDP